MAIHSYKDLLVWQKSIQLVKDIYEVCNQLPKEEIYGISSQIKRSAVSLPSNIAEGYGRKNTKEYIQFLRIAYGSGCELETQLILIRDIFNIETSDCEHQLTEVQKMLYTLFKKLETST